MLRIKNKVVPLIFTLVLCCANSIFAQDSCEFAAYKFLPVVMFAPKPAYPAKAVIAKAEGDVLVDVTIDVTGKIVEATFVSGHELFKKPVMDAAIKWKFNKVAEVVGVRSVRLIFTFYLNADAWEEPNIDEIRYKYHLKIYRPFGIGDCFNDCGKTKEKGLLVKDSPTNQWT